MSLTWERIVNHLGDPPIFVSPIESERPLIMTISETEVAVYQPYYDTLESWLERIAAFLGLDAIAVNEYSVGELFGRIAVHFIDLGITLTYESIALIAVVVAYLKSNLIEGVKRQVRETIVASDDAKVSGDKETDRQSTTATSDPALSDILVAIHSKYPKD